MILNVTNKALNPPISLDQVKKHARAYYSYDDDLFTQCLYSSWQKCEQLCQKTFCTTTYTLTLDAFPIYSASQYYGAPFTALQLWFTNKSVWPLFNQAIVLPKPPVQSISSIVYVDSVTGTLTTLASANYLFVGDQPARVTPAYGLAWPIARFQPGAVQIQFVAGYGDPGVTPDPVNNPVPAHIQSAVGQYATFLYMNRGDADADVPSYIKDILLPEEIGAYS